MPASEGRGSGPEAGGDGALLATASSAGDRERGSGLPASSLWGLLPAHLPNWDHLNTHAPEKELFLLPSTIRDPKTKVKDIGQGLASGWGRRNRVPDHSTCDLSWCGVLERILSRKSDHRAFALTLPLAGGVGLQTFIPCLWTKTTLSVTWKAFPVLTGRVLSPPTPPILLPQLRVRVLTSLHGAVQSSRALAGSRPRIPASSRTHVRRHCPRERGALQQQQGLAPCPRTESLGPECQSLIQSPDSSPSSEWQPLLGGVLTTPCTLHRVPDGPG